MALVVGSTSGIGKAIAESYAGKGAQVIVTGRRKDIANAALFLSCDDSRFITGQILNVDCGASIG